MGRIASEARSSTAGEEGEVMIRIQRKTPDTEREALRKVLGMPESSGSVYGSTTFKSQNVCPRAARLRALGVRKTGPNSDALDFGDAFHLVLEAYYLARQRGATWRDAVADAWKVLDPLRGVDGYDEMNAELERVLTSYFEFAVNDQWRVIAVEEEIIYEGPEFNYSARLDLVVEDLERGGMWIVEHKSTATITANSMQGYLLDVQTLGQCWLMYKCIDLTKYPHFRGLIVNMTSKQKTPKHERVFVYPTPVHMREFERSTEARTKMHAFAAELGYPKMLGNCTGAAQYFGACAYFDICYGRPEFDIKGVDKLLPEDLPFGFTVADTALTNPDTGTEP